MERLFVYGSLQPGRENAHLLDGLSGTWESATVRGRLVQQGWGAHIGFPALTLDEAGSEIRGHVFASDDLGAHWDRLDAFEGEEYERALATVSLGSGETATAHVYVLRER